MNAPKRIATYRKYLLLCAESAGLEWNSAGQRIRELAAEKDLLGRSLDRPSREGAPEVGGLYWCCEELSHLWMPGTVDPWIFAFHSIDFLARELDSIALPELRTAEGLAHAYGPQLTGDLIDLAAGMLENLRVEHRRFETLWFDEEKETELTIYASLTDFDERFDEAPAVKCEGEDEGATLITIASLDGDAFQGLCEEIERRDAAGRRAMRGEPLPIS